MDTMLLILLLLAIALRFFPSKNPNGYWGYQLGSAKKNSDHWRIANRFAPTCMVIMYAILILLSLILRSINYDDFWPIITLLILGSIVTVILTDRRLRLVQSWFNSQDSNRYKNLTLRHERIKNGLILILFQTHRF